MQAADVVPTIADTMAPIDDHSVYRELGVLSAKVESLEEGQSDLRAEVKADNAAINVKLDLLLQARAESQGSRKALWAVGAASGGGGGLLIALAQWWVATFGGRGGHP